MRLRIYINRPGCKLPREFDSTKAFSYYKMVAFNCLGVACKKWVTTTAPLAKSAGIVLQSLPTKQFDNILPRGCSSSFLACQSEMPFKD